MDQQWLETLHWIQNLQAFGVSIEHAVLGNCGFLVNHSNQRGTSVDSISEGIPYRNALILAGLIFAVYFLFTETRFLTILINLAVSIIVEFQ